MLSFQPQLVRSAKPPPSVTEQPADQRLRIRGSRSFRPVQLEAYCGLRVMKRGSRVHFLTRLEVVHKVKQNSAIAKAERMGETVSKTWLGII